MQSLWRTIGPGVVMSGAAIGGSHLVASTRAGAAYGFALVGLVIAINVVKYPFFQFSQRYTAATGKSLLEGYLSLGKPYLFAFFFLSFVTGTVNIAGVTLATAALATSFGLSNAPLWAISAVVVVVCVAIVLGGRYKTLDATTKSIVGVLTVATVAAAATAAVNGPVAPEGYRSPDPWTIGSIGFLVALMGWMPAPIDISVWPSLWTMSKQKRIGKKIPMRDAMLDFNVGYVVTGVLALLFLALGALVMHGSGERLHSSGALFANQFVELYTRAIGPWAFWIIAVAAAATMFSTSLTCVDGYPRSMAACSYLLWRTPATKRRDVRVRWILLVNATALVIVFFFKNDLLAMLDLAMILAFVATPVFAYLNYRAMTSEDAAKTSPLSTGMKIYSWAGIVYLLGFLALFFYWFIFVGSV